VRFAIREQTELRNTSIIGFLYFTSFFSPPGNGNRRIVGSKGGTDDVEGGGMDARHGAIRESGGSELQCSLVTASLPAKAAAGEAKAWAKRGLQSTLYLKLTGQYPCLRHYLFAWVPKRLQPFKHNTKPLKSY